MQDTGRERKRILILGGGFGGIHAAIRLSKILRKEDNVEVTLINKENYFVFQPMLPEVAASGIEVNHILNPIRRLCPKVDFRLGEVQNIDLENKEVVIRIGMSTREQRLHFDHLVLALGNVIDLSNMPGMAEHSLTMKTLGDAFFLRNHVLSRLEEADSEDDPVLRRALLSFVVVGGGFSGVETVAELNDMVRESLRYYRDIDPVEIRVLLIHSRDRILPELNESLADFALRKLRQRGVEVMLNTRVRAATADSVILPSGEQIPTKTLVSTLGAAPNPLLATIPCPQDERGCIKTNEYLEVPGYPSVWAVGDCASVPLSGGEETCPPTAQFATRQGRLAGANIAAELRGRPKRPFTFGGLGQLVSLGRRSAVAQIIGWRVSGFFAWWLWRTVYLISLPSLERKIRVAIDWTLDLVFARDIVQLKFQRAEQVARAHYEAGEDVIRQGELADRFYVIVNGEVEVVRKEPGQGEVVLAKLGKGEYFGEMGLLGSGRRGATVRTITAVDVVTVSRDDFLMLAKSAMLLQQHLDETMRQRSTSNQSEGP